MNDEAAERFLAALNLVTLVEDILTDPDYGGDSWHRIAERIVSAVSAEIDGDYRKEAGE